ncbi:hypothetical protein [Gloeocapsa sp. PCC 73106]|uniref:hypothetical protein n=1 Tax=Gloeocapsa sp. PCC 73106 TaxID=102232 RepID=UPI0002ACD28B|nr:hypothetical protein [Gloeocapsa sp. PCC 73106]ELR99291.1 hypothetical protein GLO73106DRAFT_00031410 [Gloeocapsa sp. PCC 73106]
MLKHIILTNGRSGSNNLVNLLNLHPQITNYGEVLGGWTIPHKIYTRLFKEDNYEAYLDYIYKNKIFFYLAQSYSAYAKLKQRNKPNFKFYHQIKTIGVKDFAFNFTRRTIPDYLKARDILIIFLYRENLLKRVLSRLNLRKTRVIAITDDRIQEKNNIEKIHVPIDELIPELDVFNEEQKEQLMMIEGIPEERILRITFEQYFASSDNQNEYNNRIFDFLNVDKLTLKSSHKKILPNKLVDIIENYEEVFEVLKNTKYNKFLEE